MGDRGASAQMYTTNVRMRGEHTNYHATRSRNVVFVLETNLFHGSTDKTRRLSNYILYISNTNQKFLFKKPGKLRCKIITDKLHSSADFNLAKYRSQTEMKQEYICSPSSIKSDTAFSWLSLSPILECQGAQSCTKPQHRTWHVY